MIDPNKNRMTAVFTTPPPAEKRPTMVTLRIDESLWARFGQVAESKFIDRSALLRMLIKDCIDREG